MAILNEAGEPIYSARPAAQAEKLADEIARELYALTVRSPAGLYSLVAKPNALLEQMQANRIRQAILNGGD
jgi:hypothetical protein